MTTTSSPVTVAAPERDRGLIVNGLAVAVVGALGTTLLAAILGAAGVDFELPDGGESIPLTGFTVVTFGFSIVGLALAAVLNRWSRRPRPTFVRVTVSLTVLSLVPPFLQDANAGTVAGLVLLHLTAAAIVITGLARRLDG
jgi:Family of unknown function (DUF6069)